MIGIFSDDDISGKSDKTIQMARKREGKCHLVTKRKGKEEKNKGDPNTRKQKASQF